MNFKKAFFSGIFLSILVTACNKEDGEKEIPEGKPINFQSEIVGKQESRASGTEWDPGDAIGIYMKAAGAVLSDVTVLADNKKHTTTGNGNFTYASENDKILFPTNGSNVDFIAYYPYKAGITQYFYPINVGGNQSSKLSEIDLLYSDNLINKNISSNDAILGFTHQMATIVLNIEDKTGYNLAGMIVTVSGTKTNADFSLVDASFIDDGTVSDIIAATSINGIEATSQAIIIPIKSLTGAKILFNIPSHGKTYTWDIPTRDFDGKNKYSYDVEIKAEGIVVLNPNSNITDWIDNPGGTIEIGDGGNG